MNYLKRAGKFRTKKRLGQNFLVNEKIISKIVTEAQINHNDTVVEIGPGIGFVTERLAAAVQRVIAIELDQEAVNILKKLPFPNIEVIKQDILKTELSEIVDSPVKIIANIPYYITSPIISHILGEIDQPEWKNRELTSEIIMMVQYEVARRLVADQNSPSKEYGLLSILVNYWCEPRFICKVPASSFYPSPKVDSALVKLTVRKEPAVNPHNPAAFREVTQAAFGTRRKTIKNALVNVGFAPESVLNALRQADIDPSRRGETLSLAEFVAVCDSIEAGPSNFQ